MKVRLAVDLIACDGRGLCAELLPELITLDDWGYPMLARREVPAALRGEAETAVQLCPKLALRLEARPPGSTMPGSTTPGSTTCGSTTCGSRRGEPGFMMLSPSPRMLDT